MLYRQLFIYHNSTNFSVMQYYVYSFCWRHGVITLQKFLIFHITVHLALKFCRKNSQFVRKVVTFVALRLSSIPGCHYSTLPVKIILQELLDTCRKAMFDTLDQYKPLIYFLRSYILLFYL